MSRPLLLPLTSTLIVAGIMFPPILPYIAVYIVLCAAILALSLYARDHWDAFGYGSIRLLFLCFALFLISIPFSFQGMADLSIIALLAPVFVALPIAMLLEEEPQFSAPQIIGFFSLIGAICAAGVALNDIYVLHMERAGGGNNPIHFAGMAIVLGFFALVGLFGSKQSAWRFLFLTGPLFGMIAAALSGSRGPVLSGCVLGITTVPLLLVWFWRDKLFRIVMLVGLAAGAGLTTQIDSFDFSRVTNVASDITAIFDKNIALDGPTEVRLVLYHAAVDAFIASPIFGHGSGQFASAAGAYMPEQHANLRHSEHLHADIADFATIGGILGLLAYAMLLGAPMLAFKRAQSQQIRRAALLGGGVLTVGYFSLGLTNAVFGILPQTALFGILLGTLLGMAHSNEQ